MANASVVRRVKCDETRPACLKCTSTGRTCEGYPGREGNEQANDAVSSPSTHTSVVEQRAIHFFQCRTILQLAWFCDLPFWNRSVLQAAAADSAIRHAVMALSSVHESFAKSENSENIASEFASREYGLAIADHLARLQEVERRNDGMESYLTSCVLFICIEMLLGHFQSVASLTKQAVSLLQESRHASPLPSVVPREAVESLLCRLQAQAIGLLGPQVFTLPVPVRRDFLATRDMPERFVSISDAKEQSDWYNSWHDLTQTTKPVSTVPSREPLVIANYLHIIDRWSSAFDSLKQELHVNLSEQDARTIAVLSIYQRFLWLAIELATKKPVINTNRGSTVQHDDAFQTVVEVAENVINQSKVNLAKDSREQTRFFTLDFGLLVSLYDTARNCQDLSVRQKAISLLRVSKCREGLFDGLLAAHVAEEAVQLAESSTVGKNKTASDVPEWARVLSISPQFEAAERRTILAHARHVLGAYSTQLGGARAVSFC